MRNIIKEVLDMKTILRVLLVSEMASTTGLSLIAPYFSIYLSGLGGIHSVAIATGIFLFTKAIFQLPIGKLMDENKIKKEALILGGLITSVSYFWLMFIDNILNIYFLQFFLALGSVFSYLAFMSLFTRMINVEKQTFSFGVYDAMVSLVDGLGAFIGGILIAFIGFKTVFGIVAVLNLVSIIVVYFIKIPAQTQHQKPSLAQQIKVDASSDFHGD